MIALFLKLLNMSIVASWIILALLILRPLLKKAPKWITCLMWAIVGIRLIMPISFESVFSLLPTVEPIPNEITEQSEVAEHVSKEQGGTSFVGEDDMPSNVVSWEEIEGELSLSETSRVPSAVLGTNEQSEGVSARLLSLASVVWIFGMVGMVIYALYSYLRIYFKVRSSVLVDKRVYMGDEIDTPFILGLICPRIYVPSAINENEQKIVLLHERAHLARLDHIWKPLGYAVLTVYWFNPLIWMAYYLLCKDIEFACDERVIKKLDASEKVMYTTTLLQCSVPRKMISACPLAFGEVRVKERIKTVLSYKKPTFWIIIIAVIACIVFAVAFLTNPKEEVTDQASSEEATSDPSDDTNAVVEIEFQSVTLDVLIDSNKITNAAKTTECIYTKQQNGSSVYAMLFRDAQQLNKFITNVKFDSNDSDYEFFSVGDIETRYDQIYFDSNDLLLLFTVGSGKTYRVKTVLRENEECLIAVDQYFDLTDELRMQFHGVEFSKQSSQGCSALKLSVAVNSSSNSDENSKPEEESQSGTSDPDLPNGKVECEFNSYKVCLLNDFDQIVQAIKTAGCVYTSQEEKGSLIVKFENDQQLSVFADALKDSCDQRYVSYFDLGETINRYNEEYFKKHDLVIVYTHESSGGNQNHLQSVVRGGETLSIVVLKSMGMTDDSREVFNCLEFSKKEITDCKEFDLVITQYYANKPMIQKSQSVALSDTELDLYLDYLDKELMTETFLLCLDNADDVKRLIEILGQDSAFASKLGVYDTEFFKQNSLYLFYSQEATVEDTLEISNKTSEYHYFEYDYSLLRRDLYIEISHHKTASEDDKGIPQILMFGLEREDYDNVSYNVTVIEEP